MISQRLADQTIKPADGGYHHKKQFYNTDDIIELVLWADRNPQTAKDTVEFARHIQPTKAGMKELFDFLRFNIRYKRDPKKSQWVRSPARFWSDRQGDCKSYTVFIISVLQNLGLDYIIRFTSYKRKDKRVRHVYPIAILPGGEQVIIDPVWALEGGRFNTEKRFFHKIDYKVKEGLAYLSGTNNEQENILDVILEIDRTIPDAYLQDDVTKMTEGELQRYLMAERLQTAAAQANNYNTAQNLQLSAGIIKTADEARVGALEGEVKKQVFEFLRQTEKLKAPAFRTPKLKFKSSDEIAGKFGDFLRKIGKGIKKIGKGAKDVVKAVGKFFKEAWAKLMNWIFKKGLVEAGPFFLFSFIKKPMKGEVGKRKAKQAKVINFLEKVGMKRSNIDAAITNGVVAKLGATPQKILNEKAGVAIAGPGIVAAVIKAVGWVIQVIEKIVKLFKKDASEAPAVSEEDTSDIELIEEMKEEKPGKISPNQAGMGVATVILLLLGASAFKRAG
jgi:hypothetical protein